jgi:hypothetical protein
VQELIGNFSAVHTAIVALHNDTRFGYERGYWIKNYKGGYDILKPLIGNILPYNTSHNGKRILTQQLEFYQTDLQNHLNKLNTAYGRQRHNKIEAFKIKMENRIADIQAIKIQKLMRTRIEENRVINTNATKIQELMRTRFGKIVHGLDFRVKFFM